MQAVLQITLTLHLIALAMAIGITLANAISQYQFWKLYDSNKEQGLAAFKATTKFRVFGIIGLMVSILTGLIMLWLLNWSLTALLWFKIKLAIVVLLFVNGFTLGRTTSDKLDAILKSENNTDEVQHETIRLRRNMQLFQLTQLSMFIIIIILAVFRFN
ncbi:MAG: hypothetical protein IPO83_00925 [Chitinophagaceae bacterium]|nr:hypothetical protein [Chitinophagaceae bacterium]